MKRIKFGKYAGVKRSGQVAIEKPTRADLHIQRVMWLTAMVESGGMYGCALNYDGTGMTAGLHQAIAVYPKALDDGKLRNDQGPLWDLVYRCRNTSGHMSDILDALWNEWGIVVDPDGKLRCNDKLVGGKEIREIFTGDKNGVMPSRGEDRQRAERMVTLFSKAFTDPDTYEAQHDHGARFVYKRANRWGISISDMFDDEWDLASAVFWSFCVNAPAIGRKVFAKHGSDPRRLVRALGNSKYGRWPGSRYPRTRKYAMKLWDKGLFKDGGIMPKEL